MEDMRGSKVISCERCPALVSSRTMIVNGDGKMNAEILFVGEGPGREEDISGKPFVGRSGLVLDRSLQENGISRGDVRITNCVRCRPPENRNPSKKELSNCKNHLYTEIALVDPKLIVALGRVPSEHLLQREVLVTKEAGEVELANIEGVDRSILICIHPAATLYNPNQKVIFESAISKAVELVGLKMKGAK
ncbi:uracil-DNA glycosylase [Candidatus Hikarchaeum yamanae]|uniref:uracil-DNA glycosylase n=1 Tax=Candidatus Hikarchaeum yamanae TaxID=2675326 RepID=UPI0039E76A81